MSYDIIEKGVGVFRFNLGQLTIFPFNDEDTKNKVNLLA